MTENVGHVEWEEQVLFWKNEVDLFARHLHEEGKLKADTVDKHVDRMFFFTEAFLAQYDIPYSKLDGETVVDFLGHFYIRKVMGSTRTEVTNYVSSLKRWAQFLQQESKISSEQYQDVVRVCKHKDYFLNRHDAYTGASEEWEYEEWLNSNSLEAYLEQQEQEEAQVETVEVSFSVDQSLLTMWRQAKAPIPPMIRDFQLFLQELGEAGKIKLTEARQHLPRKFWKQLDEKLGTGWFYKQTLNQEDIPVSQFMYQAALQLGLFTVSKQQGLATEHVNRYLALKEEEQLALLLDALWNKVDWESLQQSQMQSVDSDSINITQESRQEIAGILAAWPVNENQDAYSDWMQNKLKGQLSQGSSDVFLHTVALILVRFELISAEFPQPNEIKYAFERTPKLMAVTQAGHQVFGYWGNGSVDTKIDEETVVLTSTSTVSAPVSAQVSTSARTQPFTVFGSQTQSRVLTQSRRRTVHHIKMPIRVEPTPGRNDPCSCGSGKKYKKCCL
nr:SEC-C metal-binding domain-containing protein [Paenibacillus sp. YPD9-1]